MLRLAFAAVLALSPVPASAETRVDVNAWLCQVAPKAQRCRVKPVASPTVLVPAPQTRVKPGIAPTPAPESPRVQSNKKKKAAAPKMAKSAPETAKKPPITALVPAAPISCSEARQGVSMPCIVIRANAYRYERLSPTQKRHADNCLTASERAAIKACFK